MSRISLIIPCYRDAATIGRALESVYRQTRLVEEVIVVIDCSPETEEIERALKSFPRVVLIKHAINLGLAATRNTGVEAATGDIVTFLDADDELHPQKIELQLSVMSDDMAVACRTRRIFPGQGIEAPLVYEGVGRVEAISSVRRMLWTNYLTGASMMISKGLMTKMGGYDPSLRSCEDYDLWLRLLETGVVIRNLSLPLYLYHMNPSGLSNDCKNISYWEIEVLKRHCDRNGKLPVDSLWSGCLWAWWMLKHLVRAEAYHDDVLRTRTARNIALLSDYPVLCQGLQVIERSRVLKVCVALR